MGNDINELSVTVRLQQTNYHQVSVQLSMGNRGILLEWPLRQQTTWIAYEEIQHVWVQVIWGRFYRELLIETATEGYHLQSRHIRPILHVLNRYLPRGTVRHQ